MKKIYALLIVILFLTGCSATANISIDKDSVVENIKVYEQDTNKYNQYKKWNGFPTPLYYDQKLKAPLWMPNREKETGVSYYEIGNDDNSNTITASGKFKIKDHTRSYLVRNCFKLYNVINEGSKTIFSTSKGLICAFRNFEINIATPYTVITNNANKVDTQNNIYTWNINSSNAKNASIFLEIDFSKKYNEEESDANNNIVKKQDKSDTTAYLIVIILLIAAVILGINLYVKKRNTSNL